MVEHAVLGVLVARCDCWAPCIRLLSCRHPSYPTLHPPILSAATANKIYEECDGMELMKSEWVGGSGGCGVRSSVFRQQATRRQQQQHWPQGD